MVGNYQKLFFKWKSCEKMDDRITQGQLCSCPWITRQFYIKLILDNFHAIRQDKKIYVDNFG